MKRIDPSPHTPGLNRVKRTSKSSWAGGTSQFGQWPKERFLGPRGPLVVDKAPRLSISIVIWILSSDTETSATIPLGGGARKVSAK